MMKKILPFMLVAVFTVNNIYAQETVIFRKDSKSKSSKKKKSDEDNIIKISPLSFIGGVIPVYYERTVNDFFAVQAGIGVTTHNYLKDLLDESDFYTPVVKQTHWNDGTTDTYDNQSTLTGYDHRSAKIGYFAAIEPRIYFESDGLEGSFIGISYSYSDFKSNAQKINTAVNNTSEPIYTNNTFAESEKISDVMATFGTQTLYDRISLEYNIGIGLRNLKGQRYVFAYNNNGNYVDGYADIQKTKINFTLSLKVGYHF